MTIAPGRTWLFPRLLLHDWIAYALLIWSVCLGATGLVAAIAGPDISPAFLWTFVSIVAPWFAIGIGAYVMYETFTLLVSNGQTRRDAALELAFFSVVFAASLALLVTTGFAVLRLLFGSAQPGFAWYGAADIDLSLHVVFVRYVALFLVLLVAGALAGAGLYRGARVGAIAIAGTACIVIASEGVVRSAETISQRLIETTALAVPLMLLTAAVGTATAMGLTWLAVRNLPIRTR